MILGGVGSLILEVMHMVGDGPSSTGLKGLAALDQPRKHIQYMNEPCSSS